MTRKVSNEILKCSSKKDRANLIKHFITVAEVRRETNQTNQINQINQKNQKKKKKKKCKLLNNFNGLNSILAALTSSPVHRLSKTWEVKRNKETKKHEKKNEKKNY